MISEEEIIEAPDGAQEMYDQQADVTIKDGIMANGLPELFTRHSKRLRQTGDSNLFSTYRYK